MLTMRHMEYTIYRNDDLHQMWVEWKGTRIVGVWSPGDGALPLFPSAEPEESYARMMGVLDLIHRKGWAEGIATEGVIRSMRDGVWVALDVRGWWINDARDLEQEIISAKSKKWDRLASEGYTKEEYRT